ncbi:MAG: efflux RND transporter periplasmic adaptor subunit [Parachlamydia sp.]|nr:efflux RND transporter periplasmic adaptor subunit [Parachlamydia sp.]
MRQILYFLVVCLLTACSGSGQKKEERAVPVVVGEAVERSVPIYIEAIGNVYSLQTVQVRPQVTGIVVEAYVKQGQYVKKGDPLYLIDPRPYQATLDKAKATLVKDMATLQFNEIRVKRYTELTKEQYYSKVNFEQFQSEAEVSKGQIISDQADIDTAALYLEWSKPRSPIDGKISQYNIDPGNLVVANDPNSLTDIRQIDPADIRFTINQREFIEVQKAMKAGSLKFLVILPQDPDKPREGQIYFIDNHIDLATGTILLKGTVPNQDEMFWPGEYIRVRLELREEPKAVLVPEEALRIGQDGPYVYVFQEATSTVDYRKVVKGETIQRMVLIEKGVKAGEKVVVMGQLNLRPGVKVKLVDKAP